MHLLFQIEGSGVGGNETTLKTLSSLLRKNHRLTLICPPGPARKFLTGSFDRVVSPPRNWKGWDRVLQALRPTRAIAIHGDIVALSSSCRRMGIPVDWWCGHSIAETERGQWQSLGETLFDRVLFPSLFLRKQLPISNGFILPGIVDTKKFNGKSGGYRKWLGVSENAFVFGYCGRFVPEKRHEDLLDALKQLNGSYFALLIGNAHRAEEKALFRRLERRVRQEKLAAHCLSVPDKDLSRALAAMDVFVSPSVNEGFGSSVLEALSGGVPVVAARSGGPEEILQQLDQPLLYSPGNIKALAQLIRKLSGDRELGARLGQAGRHLVLKHYRPERWWKDFSLSPQS